MYRDYEDVFQDTPAMHAKLVVGTRNRRNAQHKLVRKRPPTTILQNTITKSKSSKKYISINFPSSIGQQTKKNKRLQRNTTKIHPPNTTSKRFHPTSTKNDHKLEKQIIYMTEHFSFAKTFTIHE